MATPAEIEESLSKAQPLFDKMNARYDAVNTKWANEIAMLERRVNTLYEEVDLGSGDRIAVRTALSNQESKHIGKLDKERAGLDPAKDEDRLNEISYEILEILTANPLLTKEWFAQNPDRYALTDALRISLTFYENIIAKAGRKQATGNFRKEQ